MQAHFNKVNLNILIRASRKKKKTERKMRAN